jgi:hypothetical protein
LPNVADYEAYEKARLALAPNLSRKAPAARYGVEVRQHSKSKETQTVA